MILESGARPVVVPGHRSLGRDDRSVDWARSFSSLTERKSHNGLRLRALTRIAGCARSHELLRTRGWKNVHQIMTKAPLDQWIACGDKKAPEEKEKEGQQRLGGLLLSFSKRI